MADRPTGRQRNVTGQGTGASRRGSGLGSGPVGGAGGHGGFGGGAGGSGGGNGGAGGNGTRGFGGGGLLKIILIAVIVLLGGGAGLKSLLGGFFGNSGVGGEIANIAGNALSGLSSNMIGSLLGGSTTFQTANTDTNWVDTSESARRGVLDTTVAEGSRAKYTSIKGNGNDVVTILVYLCGTDLESRNGMASNDLREMLNADLSDKVNIIVCTGGCKGWKTSERVSSSLYVDNTTTQIYKVSKGSIQCLVRDNGRKAMTAPSTLSDFIKWGVGNYPADRYDLIFWDHGGGSVTGYGHDENYSSEGSMDLSEIDKALTDGGVKFDFVGFDACLMATLETALMLSDHADYLIASEETEPGIGWYYTNWLTKLSANTSMPTTEIGKNIIDDFIAKCDEKGCGKKTTLSLVDLAELSHTVPSDFSDFAKNLSAQVNLSYKTVSDARAVTKEFSANSKIDQVDLVHLALNIGTKEGVALADSIKSAVKYNRTSDQICNAYGLSIYFPQNRPGNVKKAKNLYSNIEGMDKSYSTAIQGYADKQSGGQSSSSAFGGTGDALQSLLSLAGSFMSSSGKSKDVPEDQFDGTVLTWTKQNGKHVMALSEKQWQLVHDLEMNLFVDDGEGYIDLGLDNVFDFTDEGALIADESRAWLTVNGQFVAYYHDETYNDGKNYRILGHIPALLNDSRVNLQVVFDNQHKSGYIAGATYDYKNGETETMSKDFIEIEDGDTIDFLCDYYTYGGAYQDSYKLGDRLVVNGELKVSDGTFGNEKLVVTYRFTDIYNQTYWSEGFAE
jgi:hypothetical protein